MFRNNRRSDLRLGANEAGTRPGRVSDSSSSRHLQPGIADGHVLYNDSIESIPLVTWFISRIYMLGVLLDDGRMELTNTLPRTGGGLPA